MHFFITFSLRNHSNWAWACLRPWRLLPYYIFVITKTKKPTFSNGIPGILMLKTKNLYVFQLYSKYFHTQTLNTIRFPMVFQVVESLRGFEDGEVPSRKVWEAQKRRKPVEHAQFLMFFYDHIWNTIGSHIVSLFLTWKYLEYHWKTYSFFVFNIQKH